MFILNTLIDNFKKRIVFVFLVIGLIFSILITGCSQNSNITDENTIVLYGFSVKGEVFDQKIIPAFKNYWKQKTNKDIEFATIYAGSGKIAKQVMAGSPAEVMILSTEWDAMQLKKTGLITTDWNTFPNQGTVSMSPWVIVTRNGNPKKINDFSDLTKEGIQIVQADPLTSGGACWAVFSIYGSALEKKFTKNQAKDLLAYEVKNVISWQASAREALSQFDLGYGDAILTYEAEALLTKTLDRGYYFVYPPSTIYSEHKVVIIDKNISIDEQTVINEFVQFLFTSEVQNYFVEYGFRSINEELNSKNKDFPAIEKPFKVDYLGGWERAYAELIDGVFSEIKNSK